MKKFCLRIALTLAVMLAAAAVALPFLVRAEAFRPLLQDELGQALGRPVTLGQLSFSVLTGSVEANQLAIADDPAFSAQPFLKAEKLKIGVELWPLLRHRQLHVTRLAIEAPAIQLLQSAAGAWNFSSIGTAGSEATPAPSAAVGNLTVDSLRIVNGRATVATLASNRPPFIYTAINLNIDHFALDKAFEFALQAELPQKGKLELKGSFGPLATGNLADTPFGTELAIGHFDPVASGVIAPEAGMSMLLDVKARIGSDGQALVSQGRIEAQRLHLARTGSPARSMVAIDYYTTLQLATRSGQLQDLGFHAGPAVAHIRGSYQLSGTGTRLDLRLLAPSLPVEPLEDLLPAAGITLPQGSKLVGGTLSADLTIKGSLTALTIAGPVALENSRLAGFDIGSRLEGLNPFGGQGGGTQIESLRANLVNTPAQTELNEIHASLPQVGTASGNGSINAAEQLNFNLMASFAPTTGIGAIASQGIQKGLNRLFDRLGAYGQRLPKPKANGAVPVSVTGTAAKPVIRVKLKELF